MLRACALLPAVVIASACASPSREAADEPGEPVLLARSADTWAQDPRIDNECPSAGDHTVHSTGENERDHDARCADGPGFTLDDAASICNGPVKYFTYACADFPPDAYQPDHERGWTAYFACCAGGGPPPDGPPVDSPGFGGPGGPGIDPPGYSAPSYGGPGPGFGGPGLGGPDYGNPSWGEPGYGNPSSGGPGPAGP